MQNKVYKTEKIDFTDVLKNLMKFKDLDDYDLLSKVTALYVVLRTHGIPVSELNRLFSNDRIEGIINTLKELKIVNDNKD